LIKSVSPALTAHAGGTKAAALALTEEINVITTCATALDSVLLPDATVGISLTIVNLGVATCAVYAAGTNTIDDIATANPAIIQPEQVVVFHCYTTAKWQSDYESGGVYDKIYTDTINENTAAAGVTIDGVLLKDAGVQAASVKHVTAFGTAAPNVTTTEFGDGRHITTVLTFTNLVLGAPTAGGNSAHGVLIHTLATTAISHLVKVIACEIGLTVGTVTTDTPDVGIGTAIGTGAVATLDGTGTFEDIITGQTWDKALNGTLDHFASLFTGVVTEATAFPFINAAGAATGIYLNAADGWAAGVTGNLTATGTIVIEYIVLTA
jgi:hypothetical protein